ncbi:MAG: choice-of-anchor D domain-containing protein [Casimicrobiaceae bacterium]
MSRPASSSCSLPCFYLSSWLRVACRVVAWWVACALPIMAWAVDFTVAPTNLVFGNVAVGASSSIPVTVTNTSGVAQTPNYAGGAPGDSVNFDASQNCGGVTLTPGGTCTFTYTFQPTTLGAKSSSTTIDINSQSFAITMAGTGVSAFTVAPTNLAFGNVAVGASSSIPVTVTNTSGVAQTPNYAGGAPADAVNFDASQNCGGVTLAPGGTCTFTYTFQPTTPGAKSSSTTIDINSESFAITLAGTGVGRATPTIATVASASVVVGNTVSDSATLSGGSAPTGTITFTLFGPNNATCTGTAAFTSAAIPVNGNGNYGSGNFAPNQAGTYLWIASYTGDANNNAVAGACGAQGESVVVTKAVTSITTIGNPTSGAVVGANLSDSGKLSGGFSPTGTINFTLYGPNDGTCSGPPAFTSAPVNVNGNGTYQSTAFTGAGVGTYTWIAMYSGDANNLGSTTACGDQLETIRVAPLIPTLSPVSLALLLLGLAFGGVQALRRRR